MQWETLKDLVRFRCHAVRARMHHCRWVGCRLWSKQITLVGVVIGGAGVAATPLGAVQFPVESSQITVSGRLVDPAGNPISGGEIGLLGTVRSVFSAASGEFRLIVPKGGQPPVMQVRRPGFKPQVLRLEGSWTGTIVLQPGVFVLPDVEVTARAAKPIRYADTNKYDDVFWRQRLGMGEVIDRQDIDRRGASRVPEMLEGRSGIKVQVRPPGAFDGTIVSFARCSEFPPRINVYVDGRKVQPEMGPLMRLQMVRGSFRGQTVGSEDLQTLEDRARVRAQVGEMLDRVSLGDVEFIEVFRGVGSLPAEFSDGNCGAIAIWTRQGGR